MFYFLLTTRSSATMQIAHIQLHRYDGLYVNTYTLHRAEEHWDNPSAFSPDRFREVDHARMIVSLSWACMASTLNQYFHMQAPASNTFMPFGGGARMCIGNRFAMLEMKTALAQLIRTLVNARVLNVGLDMFVRSVCKFFVCELVGCAAIRTKPSETLS
jgi:cytochrome P450